jgi:hypothetical protein
MRAHALFQAKLFQVKTRLLRMMKRVLCVAAAGQALARLCRGAGLRGLGGGGAPRQHLPAHAAPRRQRGRRLARRVTDARRRRPGAPAPAPERARARAAAAGRGRRARVGPRVAGAPGGRRAGAGRAARGWSCRGAWRGARRACSPPDAACRARLGTRLAGRRRRAGGQQSGALGGATPPQPQRRRRCSRRRVARGRRGAAGAAEVRRGAGHG